MFSDSQRLELHVKSLDSSPKMHSLTATFTTAEGRQCSERYNTNSFGLDAAGDMM